MRKPPHVVHGKSLSHFGSSRSMQWLCGIASALLLTIQLGEASIFGTPPLPPSLSCWGGARRFRPLATTTAAASSQKMPPPKKQKLSQRRTRPLPMKKRRVQKTASAKKATKPKTPIRAVRRFARRNWQRLTSRNQYTPLIMFTAPKGMSPECDAMEKIISEVVEGEMGMRVQRFDVLRDRRARALFDLLDQQAGPERRIPFLFHRESFQSLYGMASSALAQPTTVGTTASSSTPTTGTSSVHDVMLVRAWAKGRWLFPLMDNLSSASSSSGRSTSLKAGRDDNGMGDDRPMEGEERPLTEEEMNRLENEGLTNLQRKGKEAMRRRREEEAAAAAANK